MHVTLHSMLSLGRLFSNKVTRLCTSIQETENLYFTFYAFIRSLLQQSYTFMHVHPGNGKSTLHFMLSYLYLHQQNHAFMHFIQETENLLYFLYFEYACSNKITHKCASRKWKTHITFHSFSTSIQQENYTYKCVAKSGKSVLLYTYF